LSISCVTADKKGRYPENELDMNINSYPYPGMKTLTYNGNFVYEFKSHDISSSKLIIVFEGSGWGSALGVYEDNKWRFVGNGPQLIQALRNDHTIIMPEKWNRVPGINYIEFPDARYLYTKENLLECYVTSVNSYIAENNYSNIILAGSSEGSALLPLIYKKMERRDLVKGMVSISAGGLSVYETYLINIEKENVPDMWKNMYTFGMEIGDNIDKYINSIEISPFGVVYRQIASFIKFRSFDYYKNIDIPILFVHGVKDFTIAVESTKYIEKNLPEKPFDYIYYEDMGHLPMSDPEKNIFRNDIAKWVRKI
jgi:esterase/lipase